MKEQDLISYVQTQVGGTSAEDVLRGIGDDCAVIKGTDGMVHLYTVDTLNESVHFDCNWHPPGLLGRKSVSVNVSDIAAMGGIPCYVLFSLGLPTGFDEQWARNLVQGVAEGCNRYNCSLIGGDTVRSRSGISLSLTVIGKAVADRVVYRHTAVEGDVILVSGRPGHAGAGLELCRQGINRTPEFEPLVRAHLDPLARVELGGRLAESGLVHAMMDLSDGPAADLARICSRSGLAAHIHQSLLIPDPPLVRAAKVIGRDPVDLMLGGGEDYELLVTAAPESVEELQQTAAALGLPLSPIGTMTRGNGVFLVDEKNEPVSVSATTFDHFPSIMEGE